MTTSAVTIFVFVISTVLAVTGTLALVIFNDIRHQLRDHSRHIEGMLASLWPLTMRVNSMEDYLTDKQEYRPPRIIGDHERG